MESFLKQIQRIKSGLSITFFNRISKDIGLPEKHLARIINTSTSTLAVRKKTGVFSFSESERLFRIQRIYNRAMEVFQDRELVKNWRRMDTIHRFSCFGSAERYHSIRKQLSIKSGTSGFQTLENRRTPGFYV